MITTVSNSTDLQNRIAELEKLQARQLADLRGSATLMVESLSPSHLLKTALADITQSPDLRQSLLHAAIGLGAGYLGKKIYVGHSENTFRKIAGTGIQFLLANFIRKKIPVLPKQEEHHGEEM